MVFTIVFPYVAIAKLEPNNMFVLSNFEDKIWQTFDLSNKSPFLFQCTCSNPLLVPMHQNPHKLIFLWDQIAKLHLLNVVHYTLNHHAHVWIMLITWSLQNLGKSQGRCMWCQILSIFYNNDILSLLPHVALATSSAYGKWVAWTKCTSITFGASPKLRMSKMTLDCCFSG